MSQSEAKKTLNRMNNLTLQEKRGFRQIIDSLYTDLADTNTFVGSDYFVSSEVSSTAWAVDSTLGYETGLPYGFSSLASKVGFTATAGVAHRAVLSAADSAAAAGVDTTFATSGAHGLSVGDLVTLSGFAGDEEYNGVYIINTVPSTTTFDVTTPYTASLTGGVVRPDLLTCGTTGKYLVEWHFQLESTTATGNGYIKFIRNTTQSNSGGLRIATDVVAANETHPVSGVFVWDATAGDTLITTLATVNWGTAVKLPQFNISVTRIA